VDLPAKALVSFCALLAAALATLAAVALIAAPNAGAAKSCASASRPAAALSPAAENKALLCSINLVRAQNSVPPVRTSSVLRGTALTHSLLMVATGCFDHECPGEPSLFLRLRDAGYPPCGCRWSASENIAYGAGTHSAPAAVVGAWMDSPDHRAAMLNEKLRFVGIGIATGSPGAALDLSSATYTIDLGSDG